MPVPLEFTLQRVALGGLRPLGSLERELQQGQIEAQFSTAYGFAGSAGVLVPAGLISPLGFDFIICAGTVMSLGLSETLKFGSRSGCFSPLQPPKTTDTEQTNNTPIVRNIVKYLPGM